MHLRARFRNVVLLWLWGFSPCGFPAVDYVQEEQLQVRLALASQGDAEAGYAVGDMYLKGRGTHVDYEKARQWFEKAAAGGHRKAGYKLGYLYLKGLGVERDAARAFQLLQAAAEQDYAPAKFFLGQMYALGDGVRRSNVLALKWLTESLEGGYRPHKEDLEKIRHALDRQLDHPASGPR